MELSYKERINLVMQCKIIEKLYPDEADHFKNWRIALEHGFALNYGWFTDFIYTDEFV